MEVNGGEWRLMEGEWRLMEVNGGEWRLQLR